MCCGVPRDANQSQGAGREQEREGHQYGSPEPEVEVLLSNMPLVGGKQAGLRSAGALLWTSQLHFVRSETRRCALYRRRLRVMLESDVESPPNHLRAEGRYCKVRKVHQADKSPRIARLNERDVKTTGI